MAGTSTGSMNEVPAEEEEVMVTMSSTATKTHRDATAGITFRTQVRKCAQHAYVRSIADDSIFAGTGLSAGDEVLAVDVPVGGMNAVEVGLLIADSEGNVTIYARRGRQQDESQQPSQENDEDCKRSKSAKKLLPRLRRSIKSMKTGSRKSQASDDDWESVTVTAHKMYRGVNAGVAFRKNVLKSHCHESGECGDDADVIIDTEQQMLVADIEPDSIFAAADLNVGDEVLSLEVSVEGRTAQEIAELIRMSEGDVTIITKPKYPLPSQLMAVNSSPASKDSPKESPKDSPDEADEAKAAPGKKRSPLSLVSRSGMFRRHHATTDDSTNTGLTECSAEDWYANDEHDQHMQERLLDGI